MTKICKMAFLPSILCSAAFLFAVPSSGFVTQPQFVVAKTGRGAPIYAEELPHTAETLIATKEFQLEEKEDQDTEITQVFLNDDRTVTLAGTNGPPFKACEGTWSILETAAEADQPFRMRLDRTYEAGTHTGASDPGEFDYHVKREFWGNMGMVGESVSVTGDIHGLDEAANVDCQVGYFSLIDNSEE